MPDETDPKSDAFDPEDPDNWVGIDYIHDSIRAQLDDQSHLWEAADSRLRLIMGVTSIVFAVAVGLVPRGTATLTTAAGIVIQPQRLSPYVDVPAVVGLIAFFTAALIAAVAYWPRDFNRPGKPDGLQKYVTTNPRVIKWIVVTQMIESYAKNEGGLQRKVRFFRIAMVATGLATTLLGAAVIIQLVLLISSSSS